MLSAASLKRLPWLPLARSLQDDGKPQKGVKALADGKGFVKDGVEYR